MGLWGRLEHDPTHSYVALTDKKTKLTSLLIKTTGNMIIATVDELNALPLGETLYVKAKSMSSAWSYFREERQVTLVRIEKVTGGMKRTKPRSELERDLAYFSADPTMYMEIPLSIRRSPTKMYVLIDVIKN